MNILHCLEAEMAAVLLAGCATLPPPTAEQRRGAALETIGTWTEFSRLSANKLMDEYGPPDRSEVGRRIWSNTGPWDQASVQDEWSYYNSDRLVWNDKGPWKRIVVWDAGPKNLEQTVAYPVTPAGRKTLAAFDPGLRVSRNGSELTSRQDSEALNFLTVNLADEVVRGVRDPAQARLFYDLTLELAAAGKSSRYMQGLLFARSP